MMTTRQSNRQAALQALRPPAVGWRALLHIGRPVTAIRGKSQLSATPRAIVNNSADQTSPRTPLRGSPSTFGRRGARAREHEARPPARFSLLLSINQTTKNKRCALRAHQEKRVFSLRSG
jgi:hypothetical protein